MLLSRLISWNRASVALAALGAFSAHAATPTLVTSSPALDVQARSIEITQVWKGPPVITSIKMRCAKAGTATWLNGPAATITTTGGNQRATTEVTGLTPMTQYACQGQATNSSATSPWTSLGSYTTGPVASSPPVVQDIVQTPGVVTFKLGSPTTAGSYPVMAYAYQCRAVGTTALNGDFIGVEVDPPSNTGTYDLEIEDFNGLPLGVASECRFQTLTSHPSGGFGPASDYTAWVQVTNIDAPLNAPSAPLAAAANAQATISWTAAADTPENPVSGYRASVAGDDSKFCTTASRTAVTCNIPGLTNGTAYTFKVVSTNAVGSSASVVTSPAVTPATTPSAPQTAGAAPGNGQATVSWTAPASNGGSLITGYEAYVVGNPTLKCQVAATVSNCLISGLVNGTGYSFAVHAINAKGNGADATTGTVTPFGPPLMPTGVTVTPSDGSLIVSWTAPNNNGSAITGYGVGASPGGQTCSTGATGTSCIITGLTNGTLYTVAVVATNAAGNGQPGSAMGSPKGVPGAPGAATATAGDQNAVINWTAASANGGTITGYTVVSAPGSSMCTAPVGATSCTVSGLTNGTSYTFTVMATNEVGQGVAATTAAVVPKAVPSAPKSPTATAGDQKVSVSWQVPDSNGGQAIIDYRVEAVSDATKFCVATAPALTCEVTGLVNGTAYSFKVTARNSVGAGAAANTASATPSGVPGTVSGVASTASDQQANVSWIAANANGSALTKYQVQAQEDASKTCEATPPALTCSVTGLTNGSTYTFRVRAINANGAGAWTAGNAVVPKAVPTAPLSPVATRGDQKASVSWQVPANNGGQAIASYVVTAVGNPGKTCTVVAPGLSCDVLGLTNGTAYSFTVVAKNSAGDSPASVATATVTPAGLPSAVGNPSASTADGQSVVSWTAASDNGSAITKYVVAAMEDPAKACEATAPALSCTVPGLTNGSTYTFRVSAVNGVGTGVGTNATAVAPKGVPAAPTALSATPGDGAVALGWTAPASNGSAITAYTVTGVPAAGGASVTCTAAAPATACTVSGLTNGVAHDFSVVATNAVGNSVASTPVSASASAWPLLTLPLPAGGDALVQISGTPPGCVLVPGSAKVGPTGSNPPVGASFPLGVFEFSATACANANLKVAITYPQALTGMQLQKFGPATPGQPATWFAPPGLALSHGDMTVSYTVADNGAGDNNAVLGDIADPFAPMVITAPPGPGTGPGTATLTPVPTLGHWAMLMLAAMAASLGLGRMRRAPITPI